MSWRRKVFHDFRLYAVTNIEKEDSAIIHKIEAAYRNGADIVQLRARNISMIEMIKLGNAIRKLSNRFKKLYFVNDSLDLAMATDADGLHVGQDDLPPLLVRKLSRFWKKNLILGLSTHSEDQARAACKMPIDYFAVGPVFATPTKPAYGSVGLGLVRQVSGFATKPWVAIGGVNHRNVSKVLAAGARRVAVVRALFNAKYTARSTVDFVKILRG